MRPALPQWVRVLQYLKQYNPERFEFEAPPALTQDGIADAVGITRAHTALVLKRLRDRGLVEERLVHITGGRRRRKAYVPSPLGVRWHIST
jgi:CRP-like cAMP-binding protein